jgi:hypothetical protein
MADDTCHAAGHTTYEVREVLDDDPAADLGLRFRSGDFSEAIEFALEFLQPDDSAQREVSALQIVKVEGDRREVVWSYSYRLAVAEREDLIRHWGFHPTQAWRLPSNAKR